MTKIEGHRKDGLKHLKVESIIVGERFRKDFGDIEELKNSIREKGIIQPITVDSNFVLLAGNRRLRSAIELNLPTIPVIIRDFVDEIDSREIELMENIHRKDFSWAERAKLTAEIDTLFRKKHDGDWNIRKTAIVTDLSKSAIARDLELARAIETLPELAEFKTADEALKILKKMEEQVVISELRQRQQGRLLDEANPEVVTKQSESGILATVRLADKTYIISDVFEGLKNIQKKNINLIECDPPYGIDLKDKKKEPISSISSYEEVSSEEYPGFLKRLATELYRVAGKDCWLVFWFAPTWQYQVLTSLRDAGWLVDEIPAIWIKSQGQTNHPELYFARGYETFFLCRKGKPVMIEQGRLNIFNNTPVPSNKKFHPTQRPVELIECIFSCLVAGQANVLIPFLGSGSSLLACYNLGFNGFGFDLNQEYKVRFLLEAENQARKLFNLGKDNE